MPDVSGEKELPRNCGNAAFGGWEKKSKNFFPEIPCVFFPDALFEMAGLCEDEPMSWITFQECGVSFFYGFITIYLLTLA